MKIESGLSMNSVAVTFLNTKEAKFLMSHNMIKPGFYNFPPTDTTAENQPYDQRSWKVKEKNK